MGCVCRPPILTNDHCAIEIPSTSRSSPSKYITIQKRTVTPRLETNVIHIYNLLSNINTKKATSTADYPSWITRNNAHLLAQPITHIVNEILSNSYFPALWKQSQRTLINKEKTPHKYRDMRPIALTFHLGKITERVISDLIKCDLPKMRNQYAYTKELSTTDALVKFSSDISAGLDKTDTVTLQALLLDFSKAFDRMRLTLLYPNSSL